MDDVVKIGGLLFQFGAFLVASLGLVLQIIIHMKKTK